MPVILRKPWDMKASEITPEADYLNRRKFLTQSAVLLGSTVIGPAVTPAMAYESKYPGSPFSTDEKVNTFKEITTYNNFYEFGTSKSDPYHNAGNFDTSNWQVKVGGECDNPGMFNLEDFLKPYKQEERIYRLRCVEGWSMVIPWLGIPLADMLKTFKPNSNTKYVAFTTLEDHKQMPGQSRRVLDWPYREGLRIDEAMNPLTFMAVGLYGKTLPNQNGAPMRLVVPWKYGFKSIKSIVAIDFTEQQPLCTWNQTTPREYGFYSNVNPNVDHPRWSQKTERRIGTNFWEPKIKTLMFNGYGEYVASLYKGMDLRKFF